MRTILSIVAAVLLLALSPAAAGGAQAPTADTVVLSFAGGSYFSLAEEIAAAEALPLAQTWQAALAYQPAVILWVAAPGGVSDGIIAEAGAALRGHNELPAVGIISGFTQDEARQLYQRGQELRSGSSADLQYFAANGEHASAGTPHPVLIDFQSGQTVLMDMPALLGALRQAGYLSFTGHGSDDYLRLDENTKLIAGGVPALSSVVVSTGSCQTMRIWSEESIALGFARQGAAAYSGFIYSPMAGYLVGAVDDLPFRYSWPDFPIGQIAALQTRGSLQAYANFPFHYLLGDPRIALQTAPPYQVSVDEVNGGVRTIVLKDAPRGLVPVRVTGGAAYRYVEVPGWAATTDGDPFFNARLQAASLGGDKYILIKHSGGDLTLRLRERPPLFWLVSYPLTASFDDVTLFSPQGGGDVLMLAAGALFAAVACLRWLLLRRRARKASVAYLPFRQAALPSIAAGAGAALLLGLYQALRLPHAAITTEELSLNPLWLVGVFLLTAAGCCLFLLARRWIGKALALLVAALPSLLPGLFVYITFGLFNLLSSKLVPEAIYNVHMGHLFLIAAVVWLPAAWLAFWLLQRKKAA